MGKKKNKSSRKETSENRFDNFTSEDDPKSKEIDHVTTSFHNFRLPNSPALDDLSFEEKLSLLGSEFDCLTNKCLEDALKSFGQCYETTRSAIQDLYPTTQSSSISSASISPQSSPSSPHENSNNLMLEITPEFFTRMHEKFSDSLQPLPNNVANLISNRGTFLLPLDPNVGFLIYQNIFQYLAEIVVDVEENNEEDQDDTLLLETELVDSSYINEMEASESSLTEIMQLEQVLKKSREEYLEKLVEKTQNEMVNDPAIQQEFLLEKKRLFLIEKFPGVTEANINMLFEINSYSLNETIRDIEAIYDLRLPAFYPHCSLYCDMLKKESNDFDSGLSISSSSVSNENHSSSKCAMGSNSSEDEEDNDEHKDDMSDKQFSDMIQSCFYDRQMIHVRLLHFKQKLAHFDPRKSPNACDFYQTEINHCKLQKAKISDRVIQTYVSFTFQSNCIDLHGLTVKEVRSIIPEVLRRKQSIFVGFFIEFKIITGIGLNSISNGPGQVRNWILNYLQKKGCQYVNDGPGAFIVKLSRKKIINF
ncbi:hypothetical protein RDWZM_002234 [Blomia tropicalis]|uniref:Smr domain-containing protein n=1 Tax=Blomia tropicalis TaxID=40697 RepID=A0A9Q0RRD0_BLOTA|nr:hypothetical protein RDWZM_002234 [Blomia tropicalis]